MKQFLFLAVLFFGMSFSGTKPMGYGVGDQAADFKLKNVDGKMVSLSDFKDAKGYIVVFTCNHCPYAMKYEDRIIALNAKYAPLGYPVIAINPNDPISNPDDNFDAMKERVKEKSISYPYLVDSGSIYAQYGATRTPHVFLLDKAKVVQYIGAIDDNAMEPSSVKAKFLEEAIADLQAGRKVKVATTKAVGCSIKPKA